MAIANKREITVSLKLWPSTAGGVRAALFGDRVACILAHNKDVLYSAHILPRGARLEPGGPEVQVLIALADAELAAGALQVGDPVQIWSDHPVGSGVIVELGWQQISKVPPGRTEG